MQPVRNLIKLPKTGVFSPFFAFGYSLFLLYLCARICKNQYQQQKQKKQKNDESKYFIFSSCRKLLQDKGVWGFSIPTGNEQRLPYISMCLLTVSFVDIVQSISDFSR